MKQLSASLDLHTSRLIWVCDGMLDLTPDDQALRRLARMAKGVRKLSMAGEHAAAEGGLSLMDEIATDHGGLSPIVAKITNVTKALTSVTSVEKRGQRT